MAAIYTIFELNILGFQNFFSRLMAEPTNRPLVWDYDPDTPLGRGEFCEAYSTLPVEHRLFVVGLYKLIDCGSVGWPFPNFSVIHTKWQQRVDHNSCHSRR